MIREKLIEKSVGFEKDFRHRGVGEISRIEALSDAVFAFAITLLVVSLEVPHTFTELLETMRGFFAFAITFFMLFHVWYEQYKFFRRYALNDNFTIWINALLLFVVLFYVYPLKFVWNLVLSAFTGASVGGHAAGGEAEPAILREQVPTMMVIYGVGFAGAFLIFMLLYIHAYRKRDALELNELERHDTVTKVQDSALNAAVGLVSIALALFGGTRYVWFSAMSYWLIAPIQTFHGFFMGKRRKRLAERLQAEAGMATL